MVTEKLVNVGELVAARTPLVVITDQDHAWAKSSWTSRLCRGSSSDSRRPCSPTPARGIPGKLTYISPRAEFTPRNVQTADERSRLVYRVKVGVDNANGVLKPGMPVEAEIQLQ